MSKINIKLVINLIQCHESLFDAQCYLKMFVFSNFNKNKLMRFKCFPLTLVSVSKETQAYCT